MKVYLNSITGIADSMVSLYMSRRSWTREKEIHIRNLCDTVLDSNGFIKVKDMPILSYSGQYDDFMKKLSIVLKQGAKHITLLRYIEISVTVEGLHRAGQDDFDSHAKRLENRIIRSSTRLATFSNEEKSDWYKDKILYPLEALELVGVRIPDYITKKGVKFIKTDFGYIREDLQENKDVKRGLYPLAIPSNFTFKVSLTELSHILKMRDKDSFANPEVKEMMEQLKSLIFDEYPMIMEMIYDIQN